VIKFDSEDRLKPPKRERAYMFRPCDQQTVLPGARVAIAVLHESADPSWTLADPELNIILTEQAEAAAAQGAVTAVRGRRRTRLQSGDSGVWKDGLTQQQIDEAIHVEKHKLIGDMFQESDKIIHFSQLTILGGKDNLHVWFLDKQPTGSAADAVTSVAPVAIKASTSVSPSISASSDGSMDSAMAESIIDQSSKESYKAFFQQAVSTSPLLIF
jgi:hypothetical protein